MLSCLASCRRLAASALSCLAVLAAGGPVHAGTLPSAPPAEPPCSGIRDLAFVAHLDDDLLFMNPDLMANIEAGGCMRVVYLTASDAGEGEGYMLGRERGVRAAYAYMARQPDAWREDAVRLDGRTIARFVLQGNPRIELWHMRLKDPWLGPGWGSLTPLSRAESVPNHVADTLGPHRETYTRAGLVSTLAAVIRDYGPTTVRHLDDTVSVPYTELCWRCPGHSHPDHIASARLVREAMLQAPGNYADTGYVDYPSQEHEPNLSEAEIASKSEVFRRYAFNDYHYCAGPTGCQEPAGPAAAWVQRAYYVSRTDAAPALLADARAGIVLAAVGDTNDAANLWDAGAGRWQTLGGRVAGRLVSYTLADGSAGLIARDALGQLWTREQGQDGHWQAWRAMAGGRFLRAPSVTLQGTPAAVALGNDGRLHWSARADGTAWQPWQPLPVLHGATGEAVIARDGAGREVVFAADRGGRIHSITRLETVAQGWQSWRRIAAPATDGGLAAIRNGQRRIELYLRARDTRRLVRLVESATVQTDALHAMSGRADASPQWGEAADMGIEYVGEPAVSIDANGHVAVAALERAGGALWLVGNGQPAILAAHAASPPTLRLVNGELYVAARSVAPRQRYLVLSRKLGDWVSGTALAELPAGGGGGFEAAPPALASRQTPEIPTALAIAPARSSPGR